jgi:hypothetical protein
VPLLHGGELLYESHQLSAIQNLGHSPMPPESSPKFLYLAIGKSGGGYFSSLHNLEANPSTERQCAKSKIPH